MNNDYLFPIRHTRRDFLKMSTAAVAACAAPRFASAEEKSPIKFGSGQWTYTLDESWGALPDGMKYGFGCGVVVDSQDRVYVTSRSTNPCVAVFDKDGKLLETWSRDFAEKVGMDTNQVAATAHCLYWSLEGNEEFFYFTENVARPKDADGKEKPAIGKRVYKTDLRGKILYTIGNVEKENSTSQKFDWTNPTDVAVAPNGDIYVVDGYGSQRVSRFDKNFKHIKTIGTRTEKSAVGPNAPADTFNTCHGIWVNTLKSEPEIYIADRHNDRIQVYSPALEYKRTLSGPWLRNPCCFYQHDGHLYIPDLAAQVIVLDAHDQPVATLGDGKNVPKEQQGKTPEFVHPHALTVDSRGNLYVVEWLPIGRPRKLAHTPA